MSSPEIPDAEIANLQRLEVLSTQIKSFVGINENIRRYVRALIDKLDELNISRGDNEKPSDQPEQIRKITEILSGAFKEMSEAEERLKALFEELCEREVSIAKPENN